MAVQNSHLRFLPRSVQLSKPPPPPMDTDNKKMNKKKHRNSIDHSAREESNFSPTEEFELQAQRKRKRKIKNSGHVIEEESGKTNSSHAAIRVDGDSNGLKKKKEKKKKRDDPNTHSAEAAELNQLIAGFLSSRGLTNTLSVFLSETQHAYAGKAQTLDLEEIYSHYLNQGRWSLQILGFKITPIGQRMVLKMAMVQKRRKFSDKSEERTFDTKKPTRSEGLTQEA